VSKNPFTPVLVGTEFGFDFNPTVDRIRIVSDGDQNLRINPDTGEAAGTDTALAYAATDANAGANPNVVAAAYMNNADLVTTTVLHGLDSGLDRLVTQNPPNAGTLNTVGATTFDIASVAGFDIGADGQAVAVSTIGTTDSKLLSVDLTTGVARFEAQLPVAIRDLAVKLPTPDGAGYVLSGLLGEVHNFGSAQNKGSATAIDLQEPILGISARSSGQGYWLSALDGGVFAFGDAAFYGSAGALDLNAGVTGLASHPSNRGYWLVAEDGGVFSYGAAKFYGSMGGKPLNAPIVGIASTSTGQGYWLFAEDGGVFAFGDAEFRGSAGSITLNQPIVNAAASVDGTGYYLVGLDGGVFGYGPGAVFAGSAASTKLQQPVIDIAADVDGRGYTLVALDGGVFNYESKFVGSVSGVATSSVTSISTR